jgi:hypothetical protein
LPFEGNYYSRQAQSLKRAFFFLTQEPQIDLLERTLATLRFFRNSSRAKEPDADRIQLAQLPLEITEANDVNPFIGWTAVVQLTD